MKSIPEIVREYVIKTSRRMPQTNEEIDQYLDLINHSKEYAEAFKTQKIIGKRMMNQLGFKTTDEIKKSGINT